MIMPWAEPVNGLYKAELVHHFGPWRNAGHLELATAPRVSWWNQARLHSWCGYVPPAEHDTARHTARANAEEDAA